MTLERQNSNSKPRVPAEPEGRPDDERGRQFVKVYADVMRRRDLTATAKLVHAVLENRARQDGRAWPGIRRIASDIGVANNAVVRAITALERAGLVIKTRRDNGRTNTYKLSESVVETDTVDTRTVSETNTVSESDKSLDRVRNEHRGVSKMNTQPCSERIHKKKRTLKREKSASPNGSALAGPKKKRTPKKRTKTPPAPRDSRVAEFLKSWRTSFKTHRGTPYLTTAHAKDAAMAKKILAALDGSRPDDDSLVLLTDAADRFLAEPPDWPKGEPTIGILSTRLNDYVEATPAAPVTHWFEAEMRERFGDDFDRHTDAYREIYAKVQNNCPSISDVRKHAAKANGDGAAFRAAVLEGGGAR